MRSASTNIQHDDVPFLHMQTKIFLFTGAENCISAAFEILSDIILCMKKETNFVFLLQYPIAQIYASLIYRKSSPPPPREPSIGLFNLIHRRVQ